MSHSNPQGIKPGDIVTLNNLINPVTNQELRPINLYEYNKLQYLETDGQTYEVIDVIHDSVVELKSQNYNLSSCNIAHCLLSKKAEERPEFRWSTLRGDIHIHRFTYRNAVPLTERVALIDSSCPTDLLREIVAYRESFNS